MSNNMGPRTPDNDMVICPNCTCQFVAIPVNVQAHLGETNEALAACQSQAGGEIAHLTALLDLSRINNAALKDDAEFGREVIAILASAKAPTLSQWAAIQSKARELRSAIDAARGEPT